MVGNCQPLVTGDAEVDINSVSDACGWNQPIWIKVESSNKIHVLLPNGTRLFRIFARNQECYCLARSARSKQGENVGRSVTDHCSAAPFSARKYRLEQRWCALLPHDIGMTSANHQGSRGDIAPPITSQRLRVVVIWWVSVELLP